MSVARDQNLSNDRQKYAPTGEALPPTAGSIRVAVVTHPGRVRVSNEADDWRSSATVDWIIVPDKPLGAGLFVCLVADRLGGHAAGEVASRRAGRSIFGARAALVGPQGIAEILHAVDARRRMHETPHLPGWERPSPAWSLMRTRWFNVGDSRVYRVRDDGRSA